MTYLSFGNHLMLLLSTHSLDPCLWGESDHPAFGPSTSLSLHLASSSITQAGSVHKSRGGAYVGAVEEMVCMWVFQRGHSGDGCDLVWTLCKNDLGKGDLFVLSWARVRRVRRGSISSELLMCGGGVQPPHPHLYYTTKSPCVVVDLNTF